jgi:SAM-dependent methyltransferase
MRTHASAGYLTGVPYVRQFCKELSPPLLRAAAALNGFVPPPGEDFDYCEIGAGTGDTTSTLAAAHPEARFVGIDLSAEHVGFARGFAERGGLRNVRYLEGDVASLSPAELPRFDYVVAHGVLAWVAPETRAKLMDLAAACLQPGGVLYVSYNALPGWAGVEPLRRLMRDLSSHVAGGPLERARQGAAAAGLLRDCGAEYFAQNPAASEMLDTIARMGDTYAAHEYLGEHWHPMYFADVASEMAARDLAYIGQLPLYSNYRDLTIPTTALDLFQHVTSRAAFESLKDFAVNEFFRGDLYMKEGPIRDPDTTRAWLASTPFGTLVPASKAKFEVRLRHHVLRYDEAPFPALLARLAGAPATTAEIAREEAFAPIGQDALAGAVTSLLAGEQLWPMRPGARASASAYNRAVLEQRLTPGSPVVLAAPVAGTGVVVPMLQAVALRLLTGVAPADRDAWARAFVARQPVKLHVGDASVEGEDAQARVILAEAEKMRDAGLPKLVALGAFDAAS